MPNKFYVSLVFFTLAGCASDSRNDTTPPDDIVVTGTRVDPANIKGTPLLVVEPNRGKNGETSVGELLRQMQADSLGFPATDSYSSCDELIALILNSESLELVSVTQYSVKATSPNATLTYKFQDGDCHAE